MVRINQLYKDLRAICSKNQKILRDGHFCLIALASERVGRRTVRAGAWIETGIRWEAILKACSVQWAGHPPLPDKRIYNN